MNATLTDLERFATATNGKPSTFDTFLHPAVPYSRSFSIGDLPRASAHVGKDLGQYTPVPGSHFDGFNVALSALNGSWNQTTLLRRVGGSWAQATKVILPTAPGSANGKVLYQRVDKAYPKKDGKVDWGSAQGHWIPVNPSS